MNDTSNDSAIWHASLWIFSRRSNESFVVIGHGFSICLLGFCVEQGIFERKNVIFRVVTCGMENMLSICSDCLLQRPAEEGLLPLASTACGVQSEYIGPRIGRNPQRDWWWGRFQWLSWSPDVLQRGWIIGCNHSCSRHRRPYWPYVLTHSQQ